VVDLVLAQVGAHQGLVVVGGGHLLELEHSCK
jgi:hypothetical protein